MATIDLMDQFSHLGEGGIRNNGTLDDEVMFQSSLRTKRTDFIQVKAGDSIVYKNMSGMSSIWNILSFYTGDAQGFYVSGIAGQTTPQSGVWTAQQDGYVRLFGSFPAGDNISVTMMDLAPDVEDYLAKYNALNYRFLPNSIPKIVAHIQEYLSNHPIADSTTLQAVIDAAFQSYIEEIQQTADTYIAEAVPPAAAAAVDAAASPALAEITAKADEAAESARQAGLSQQSAEMSEENALTYRNQAQQIKDSITDEVSASVQAAQEQATLAQESAQAADESANTADQYVAQARAQAEAAAAHTQTASGYASDAQGYMQDASDFADNAAQSAATFTTDPTLTISGKAADAKATGDQLSDLKSALTEYVRIDGTDEVTPKNLQILDKVISPNLIDASKITDGKYITADGVEHNGNYFVTDYIPVEAGAQYCGTVLFTNNSTGSTILYPLAIRWLACYDNSKVIMPSAGSNTQIATYPYTIPDGVSFVRLSMTNSSQYSQHQFEKGEESTTYHPYGEVISAELKREYIPQEDVDMADIPAFHLVEGQNLLNKEDADYLTGKYINNWGNINNSDVYIASGYIKVNAGDILFGSYLTANGKTEPAALTYIACYDANKAVLQPLGKNGNTTPYFEVPETVEYVRVSIRIASYTQYLQIEKTNSNLPKPYEPYEAPHYEILDSYTPQGKPPLHVYLPSDIYVAVGRTIELYNEQVCIDHEKYHFRWVCAEGSAYARKFSITGTTAKNLNLDLYLYDDKRNICWCGRCVIHVVAASNPTKKILPIGDSLTNWKAWLQETMLLSGNHISWLGTRYSGQSVDSEGNTYASGTIHHEGRSGWKASDYLSNATYDFDTRYDGVETVSGTANPFWDGSKFSLSHYLSVQTGVSTPDAVQIFLGTNDVRNGVDVATADIVNMVDKIRTEYPSMPIFVCNTIYNANQNGYGSVGSDAYAQSAGASAWQYDQDCLILDLMKSLKTALAAYTGVYIIPLASCMDREYDFGQVMTKVNPRSDLEIPMPVERIHPQAVGYYQMADLMYSFYCGILN